MFFTKVLYFSDLFITEKILQYSNSVGSSDFLTFTPSVKGPKFFSFLIVCIFSLVSFNCSSKGETYLSAKRSPEIPPTVAKGKVFLAGHQGDHSKNSDEILALLRKLVEGTVKKDLNFLPEVVSSKDGIYLDLKGHWTRENLISELKSPNNYFQTYFFDRELLEKQKGSSEVRTVRDLFLLSGGIEADLYFESLSACEVKLRFKENSKLEKELINSYFIKSEGKWYLHRLF